MDALRFGRWISDRRRRYGWGSQRALVEAARREPHLSEYGISEDFLSRLEAGQLVQPFRGNVRQRVLVLGELLCKTPRELNGYLHAARLTKLSSDESDYVNRLRERLGTERLDPVFLMPPRPARFFGREYLLGDIVSKFSRAEPGLYAITGMAGVGKSTFAFEAMHQLAINEHECQRLFPGGVATFTCTGRRNVGDLISLLDEIAEVFTAAIKPTSKTGRGKPSPYAGVGATLAVARSVGNDLAAAIGRTRVALANRSTLILLDDLDAQFPLREALDALLSHELRGEKVSSIVLTTSRYVPSPALMTHHLHVGPLEPDAALELFTVLVGRALYGEERAYAEHICTAVGYLPLAIEVAASAVAAKGIALSLLAARVAENPLDIMLDGEYEVSSRLARELESFDTEMQRRFALLATLGRRSFGLESAAAIHAQGKENELDDSSMKDLPRAEHTLAISGSGVYKDAGQEQALPLRQHRGDIAGRPGDVQQCRPDSELDVPLIQFASTAADLGQFVRHSLIELVPSMSSKDNCNRAGLAVAQVYRLHPLLYAHAMDRLEQIEPEIVDAAQHNVQAYALAYLERYKGEVLQLEREREFLLTALEQAWQQEQYALVIRFVAGFIPLVGRLGNYEKALRLLHIGIYACQQVKDHYHLAIFLHRLGGLLCSHGHMNHAQKMFEESLTIAEALRRPALLWRPLAMLAYMASVNGEDDVVRYHTRTYLRHCQEEGDPDYVSAALNVDGFFARLAGDRDRAYDDISSCLRLITQCPHTFSYQCSVFEMTVRAEFARVQDDYSPSQAYTEAALSLARVCHGPYFIADLLLDQAYFAYEQSMLDDAHTLARLVVEITEPIGASHYQSRAIKLLQQLPRNLLPLH